METSILPRGTGPRTSALRRAGLRPWSFRLITLTFLALLPACDAGMLDPADDLVPALLVLNSSELELAAGDTFRLETTILSKDGTILGRSRQTSSGAQGYYDQLTWISSDTAIAQVDETGLVAAVDSGTATISVSAGDLTTSAKARVNPGKGHGKGGVDGKKGGSGSNGSTATPARIEITPDGGTLSAIGASLQFTATVHDDSGTEIASPSIKWASDDPEVVSVDSTGKVIAKLAGAALVVATAGLVADTVSVEVEQEVSSLSVAPDDAALEVGDTLRLAASVEDANGEPVSDAEIVWDSEDPDVATVSPKGVIKGLRKGTTRVSASAGSAEATVEVTVLEEPEPAPPPVYSGGPLPAFPGAEGYGATALQDFRDRPIEVLTVTSMANDGPGTLRDAIARARSDRYSIIIFRTGGSIVTGGIEVNKCGLYIAGQTAPGGGVLIRGPDAGAWAGLTFPRDGSGCDVVVRGVTIRPGRGEPGGTDAISITGGSRLIFDQISVAWGNDENIGMQTISNGGPIRDVTFQNSIVAAALRPHSAGTLIGGSDPNIRPPIERITLANNLWAHNAHRNPRVTGTKAVDFAGNVVYNPYSRYGSTVYEAEVDFRRNHFLRGPWGSSTYFWHDERTDKVNRVPSVYFEGNSPSDDIYRRRTDSGFSAAPSSYFRSRPLTPPPFPVTFQRPDDILAGAGNSRALDCRGAWYERRDRVDALIVSHVENRSGPSHESETDHQDDYGGHTNPSAGRPCADSDGDGLPDEWEERYFGSPTGANPEDSTPSGYLVIEHYLNGTDPTASASVVLGAAPPGEQLFRTAASSLPAAVHSGFAARETSVTMSVSHASRATSVTARRYSLPESRGRAGSPGAGVVRSINRRSSHPSGLAGFGV